MRFTPLECNYIVAVLAMMAVYVWQRRNRRQRWNRIARWILATFAHTSPEQEFFNKAMAEVQSQLKITGTLTVIDANGVEK